MSKRVKLWGGLGAVLAIIVIVVFWQIQPGDSSEGKVTASKGVYEVWEDDWTRGNPDAEVVVIKYSDFACPACLNYAAMDHQFVQELGDSVLFVFRHYPLPNSQVSKMAARYVEAAGRQGKFWEMHDIIFGNQQNWRQGNPIMMFRQMAEHLELNMDQLDKDIMDPEIEQKIDRDYNQGVESGVTSVPSVFINGNKMQYNPENYRSQIESYLE